MPASLAHPVRQLARIRRRSPSRVLLSGHGFERKTITAVLTTGEPHGLPQRSPRGFRAVRLNPAVRSALLVPGGAAGAGLGLFTSGSPRIGRVLVGMAAGAVAGLLIVRGVDEARRRRMAMTALQLDEPDDALDLMQAVRAAGVDADMVRRDDLSRASGVAYLLRYHTRDEPRVQAVLAAQHG